MERTLSYLLRTAPDEILEIARSRIEDHPSASIVGDSESGTFVSRGLEVDYSMKPGSGGTELKLEFTRKPLLPWTLIRSYLDREAKKW